MSETTAGQALYEALHPDMDGFVEWEFMLPELWQRFETAATAVETGQLRLAREDRDQLRKRVLDLAAALEAEGREEITIARKRQGPADETDKNRGRVFKLCASRIRKIAEPLS